jgi:hypothetical protein
MLYVLLGRESAPYPAGCTYALPARYSSSRVWKSAFSSSRAISCARCCTWAASAPDAPMLSLTDTRKRWLIAPQLFQCSLQRLKHRPRIEGAVSLPDQNGVVPCQSPPWLCLPNEKWFTREFGEICTTEQQNPAHLPC